MAHWKGILGDDTIAKKTALIEGQVAGNVVSFEHGVNARSSTARERILGQSVATAALSAFLRLVRVRPLYASVAEHNAACIRVLINAGSRYLAKTLAPPISLAKRRGVYPGTWRRRASSAMIPARPLATHPSAMRACLRSRLLPRPSLR
jgi:hypothetical protein